MYQENICTNSAYQGFGGFVLLFVRLCVLCCYFFMLALPMCLRKKLMIDYS